MSDYTPKDTKFTHPEHLNHLPQPTFEFLFHLECRFRSDYLELDLQLIHIGDMESFTKIGSGPYGNRMNVIFSK
jgi:hypothetical protein